MVVGILVGSQDWAQVAGILQGAAGIHQGVGAAGPIAAVADIAAGELHMVAADKANSRRGGAVVAAAVGDNLLGEVGSVP